jgi:hypothetical protein
MRLAQTSLPIVLFVLSSIFAPSSVDAGSQGKRYHKCTQATHCPYRYDGNVVGVCVGGSYENRECRTRTDILLCLEGGGKYCKLVSTDPGRGDPQPLLEQCATQIDGQCHCDCNNWAGTVAGNIQACNEELIHQCNKYGGTLTPDDDEGRECVYASPCGTGPGDTPVPPGSGG